MVHALRQAHKVLHPGGSLINIFNLPTPQVIEVHTPAGVRKVGWLLDRDDFKDTMAAMNALAEVVDGGDFTLVDEEDFDNRIYADDLPEFLEWLSEWWESAIIPHKTALQLGELMREAGLPARIALALRARMTRLEAA